MTDKQFKFESESGFPIGNEVIFTGRVSSGVASRGNRVSVADANGKTFVGTIRVIESERKLIEQTVDDCEIGILVNEISDTNICDALNRIPKYDQGDDVPDGYNHNRFDDLGLKLPVVISLAPDQSSVHSGKPSDVRKSLWNWLRRA